MIKDGGFEFVEEGDGFLVYHRKQQIGCVVTMLEASGRYCFRLGWDTRPKPRTYRGKVRAAQALKAIDGLKRDAKGKKLSPEELIIRSWDAKPRTAQN
jgi:hypothetical protein